MTNWMRGLAFSGLCALGVAGCQTGEAAEEGSALQTAEVTRGDLQITAEATGTIEPIRKVEVKSKASGEILRLYVDIGDNVQPGTLLAEVDPRDVQNAFDQAEADLAVAEARMEISEAQLERSNQLLAASVITPQEHENSRLDFANAQANLVRSRTNFELAELRLMDVRIRAPMAGTIIQKNVEEGTVIQSATGNVSGGTTLFVMANLEEMQVRTLVDETDMGELSSGMDATVSVEAFPDRTFRGAVDKIEPQAQTVQNVTMFPVIVSIDNRSGLLKPGMNAEVEVFIDEARGVALAPNGAIVQVSDVGPAALALGLDVESLDLGQFMAAGRSGRPGAGAAGAAGTRQGASAPSGAPSAGGAAEAAGGDAMARIQELRAKVASGEITQDSMRAVMATLREGRGAEQSAASGERASRAAIVFVLGADSIPEPRLVRIGLNDWDRTEIVSGVEEGETLVVVGAAQLMAQQQEWLNRMRSRMGGSPFGGGGRGR